MDAFSGFLIGVFFTVGIGVILAGLWYIEKTAAWDHKPTDAEVGQKIIEDFILRRDE